MRKHVGICRTMREHTGICMSMYEYVGIDNLEMKLVHNILLCRCTSRSAEKLSELATSPMRYCTNLHNIPVRCEGKLAHVFMSYM